MKNLFLTPSLILPAETARTLSVIKYESLLQPSSVPFIQFLSRCFPLKALQPPPLQSFGPFVLSSADLCIDISLGLVCTLSQPPDPVPGSGPALLFFFSPGPPSSLCSYLLSLFIYASGSTVTLILHISHLPEFPSLTLMWS